MDRAVLVTGAARRMGRAIARRLAGEGWRVAIHCQTSVAEARALAEECPGSLVFQADLSRVPEITRLYSEVHSRMGRLDGVVNNAARFTRIDPLEITEDQWDEIHDVNLKAVFFSCQQAARIMLAAEGGRIVNISSLGGLKAWGSHAHYCASKAGVIHLTRALAAAWAPSVSVNSVAPGVIPFGAEEEQSVSRLIQATPARRAGTGEEVAEAVSYFLNATRFITGQVLAVDGGLSLK